MEGNTKFVQIMNDKIKIKKRNLRVKIVGISVIDFLK